MDKGLKSFAAVVEQVDTPSYLDGDSFGCRGGSNPPLTAKFKVMRPLAWQCANCNAFNATDRVKCGKCNKDKKVKIIFFEFWTSFFN